MGKQGLRIIINPLGTERKRGFFFFRSCPPRAPRKKGPCKIQFFQSACLTALFNFFSPKDQNKKILGHADHNKINQPFFWDTAGSPRLTALFNFFSPKDQNKKNLGRGDNRMVGNGTG